MSGRPNVGHATRRALVTFTINGRKGIGRLYCIKGRGDHARCEIALDGGHRVVRPIDQVRLAPEPPRAAPG